MKKKNEIRKYNIEKVAELVQSETKPQVLKLYSEHIIQKKSKLLQKKDQLQKHLNSIRKDSQKIVFDMVEGVKDRLQKNQKIVMNSESRPTAQDIKNLSQLFSYMQNQTQLINKNSTQISNLYQNTLNSYNKIKHQNKDFTQFDEQFQKLKLECEKEQKERNQLLKVRDNNRQFYTIIKSTIAQFRVKYDIVQQKIAERQKQLDHLVSYFNVRQREDQQKIQNQNQITASLQNQLLEAQKALNDKHSFNTTLKIQQIQYHSRK